MRDHLFISYATEDWPFVEWLALRLSAEGYQVWCDRMKLLGGESYPKDIDEAIKNRTFRFLAVLSHSSIKKTNPLKERTLALSLSRERKENFVIPINLDGISPTDLDWMVSDLTFIPFHLSWAEGLAQLLKLLEASKVPKGFAEGRSAAAAWFESQGLVLPKQERLWANVAEITELPKTIYRFETDVPFSETEKLELLKHWTHLNDDEAFWAFDSPPAEFRDKYRFKERGERNNWNSTRGNDAGLRQLGVQLLNESLKSVALTRGLRLTSDQSLLYFPEGLLVNNRLLFTGYDNKLSWVRAVGIRNFRMLAGKESCRYHLAPHMRVWLDHEIGTVVQIRMHLFLTTLEGAQLEPKLALRRRKKICRSWWNYHWLVRTLAVLQFLAGDKPSIYVGAKPPKQLVISKHPFSVQIESGIDESRLGPEAEETDETIVELSEEEEADSQGPDDE
jgi:hypothetical protein